VEGLRHKPPPGATPRLSEDERAKLPELLAQGAQAHGFRGSVWRCERVAIVIRKEFGVLYHPAHVSRLLKALRQSLHKPQRRAESSGMRRPSSAGKKSGGLPSKGGVEGRQDHSVFCDQSGFYLLPTVVRTYAPVGRTPILKEHLSPEHLLRR
jgi:hypothetical protein